MHLSSRAVVNTWCMRACQKRFDMCKVCVHVAQKSPNPSPAPLLYISHRQFSETSEIRQNVIPPAAVEGEEKPVSDKIKKIVEEISGLTLLEVSDLNSLLKKTLNISDAPMMPMGMVGGMAAAPQKEEEEEDTGPTVVAVAQTSFKVVLKEFDESKKVALIKEIRSTIDGMNLVQAKKFVESLPQTVMADVGKDEAETIQKKMEAAGGTAVVE